MFMKSLADCDEACIWTKTKVMKNNGCKVSWKDMDI